MLSHRKLVKKTMQDLDHAFVEKIMTVVTAVNGCRYCSWFHARQAVSSGILPGRGQADDEAPIPGRCQSRGADGPALCPTLRRNRVQSNSGDDRETGRGLWNRKAEEIQIVIRMITFGNLSGNTFDAFLSRFKGIKAEAVTPSLNLCFSSSAPPSCSPSYRSYARIKIHSLLRFIWVHHIPFITNSKRPYLWRVMPHPTTRLLRPPPAPSQ